MKPKISVTIPIYNSESYLRKCLDSLKNQTFKDIEFILVNDGSTDGSKEICEDYVKGDNRFKLINKINEGSASARQVGLENSLGEYIIVCDSDDWVEHDMYEKLYNKAIETDADVTLCNFFFEYEDGTTKIGHYKFNSTNPKEDVNTVLRDFSGMQVLKLIKKSLYEKTNSNYVKGINLSEDVLITYKLFQATPTIAYLDEPLYHYRRIFNGNSYTNNISMDNLNQLFFTYQWIKENYNDPEYNELVYLKALDIAFTSLRTKDLDLKFYKEFLNKELPWSKIFKNRFNLKAIMSILQKTFPLSLNKFLFNKTYHFFYK